MIVAACTSYERAYGPDPVMRATHARQSTANYVEVRDTLIYRAGYPEGSAVDWYEVAVAGFGYVDEQCSQYLADLYRIRRGRDHIKNQLAAVGTTTNTILGVTSAGKVAIAATAAAFGLASQMTENASAAFLYSMDPSDIDGLLRNQMHAYREGVAAKRATYTSSNIAMEAVRGYLNLCLPVSIEAQIKAAVQSTVYVATPSNSGVPALSRVQNASPSVPSVQDIREKPIFVPPKPDPIRQARGLMAGEFALTLEQAMLMQSKICVPADGDLGMAGSRTRIALGVVQLERLKQAPSGRIDEKTWIAANRLPPCDSSIHLSTFEHIELPDATAVERVQGWLKDYMSRHTADFAAAHLALVGKPDFVGGDRLTADNREAIRAIQQLKTPDDVSGQYTREIAEIIEPL